MSNLAEEIRNIDDLYRLKSQEDLSQVTIRTKRLKNIGLLHQAARSAYFAVKPGGRITIIDDGDTTQRIEPWRIGWPTVRSLMLSCLSNDCRLELSSSTNEINFTRITPTLGPGWSAGVVFSGQEEEIPYLKLCLDGLLQQPELNGSLGEIIVCGPPKRHDFFDGYPKIKYEPFEFNAPGPFPISKKKNHLLQTMLFPRKIVLHARVVLDPNSLSEAPREFDIFSPNISVKTPNGQKPNICYVAIDSKWPNTTPSVSGKSTLDIKPEKYLSMLKSRKPYVDGGAFAVSDPVFNLCQLNPNLFWGDCEDVEWCFRAQTLGFLVDLAPKVTAVSSTSKFNERLQFLGRGSGFLRWANRIVRYLTNWMYFQFRKN